MVSTRCRLGIGTFQAHVVYEAKRKCGQLFELYIGAIFELLDYFLLSEMATIYELGVHTSLPELLSP